LAVLDQLIGANNHIQKYFGVSKSDGSEDLSYFSYNFSCHALIQKSVLQN